MNYARCFSNKTSYNRRRERVIRKFIHSFTELRPGNRVLLVACVSWRDRRANLADQLANLRQHVEVLGAVVVGVHRHIGQRYRPQWIKKAVRKVNRYEADWMLAETSCRFARTRAYHCISNPDAQAGPEIFQAVQRLSSDRLMTHLDPTATNSEIRSYQRRRGQLFKGNRGGRPPKIRYQPRYHESPEIVVQVVQLRDRGVPWRHIAEIIGRSQSTIRGWYARRRPK